MWIENSAFIQQNMVADTKTSSYLHKHKHKNAHTINRIREFCHLRLHESLEFLLRKRCIGWPRSYSRFPTCRPHGHRKTGRRDYRKHLPARKARDRTRLINSGLRRENKICGKANHRKHGLRDRTLGTRNISQNRKIGPYGRWQRRRQFRMR